MNNYRDLSITTTSFLVRIRGLEPPHLSATAPQAVASAIPPYPHIPMGGQDPLSGSS